MPETTLLEIQDSLLGEIETEIVGRQYHAAKILPGDQVNLERDSKNRHDRRAIRVETGCREPVGYLPRRAISWLAPLIDSGQIYLDGYIPQVAPQTENRCSVVLRVFQYDKGRHLLEKAEPRNELEALHQTVLQAYQNAQSYHDPNLILGLAKGLQPLEKQELLPETRLLLALLPRMAHEAQVSKGMLAMVKFCELLGTITIGPPAHHHNLTFFPLLWPETHEPSYTLLSTAIEAGEAVVEEVHESGSRSQPGRDQQGQTTSADTRGRDSHRGQAEPGHQRDGPGGGGREVRPPGQLRGSGPLAIQVPAFRVEVLCPAVASP